MRVPASVGRGADAGLRGRRVPARKLGALGALGSATSAASSAASVAILRSAMRASRSARVAGASSSSSSSSGLSRFQRSTSRDDHGRSASARNSSRRAFSHCRCTVRSETPRMRGDLGDGEAAEELQVDDVGELGLELGQLVERGADVAEHRRLGDVLGGLRVERGDVEAAAALLRRAGRARGR